MTASARNSAENSRATKLVLLLVLALSAFIQLTVVSRTVVDHPLRADAGDYFSYAWNLSTHGIYSLQRPGDVPGTPVPDKVRTPGYPLFLLAVGTPEPSEHFLRRIVYWQALLGIASVFLAYLVAASFLGRAWALVPAALTALSPHLVMMSTYVLSETLFCFLLLASTYASIRAIGSRRPVFFALAGVLWGLCSLVRPTVQFLPGILLAVALVVPTLRYLRMPVAIMFVCFATVMAPWVVRNMGLERPGPSLMLNNIAHGAYPGFMYEGRPETFGFPYRFDPDYPAHASSARRLLDHLRDRFSSEPGKYLGWFLIGKPYFFLSLRDAQSLDIQIYPTPINPYYERPLFEWMRGLAILVHWPLMLLGIAGIVLTASTVRSVRLEHPGEWTAAAFVALVVVYAVALHVVAAPFPRYAIPFRPLVYGLALLPVLGAWRFTRGRVSRWKIQTSGM